MAPGTVQENQTASACRVPRKQYQGSPLLRCEELDYRQKGDLDGFAHQRHRLRSLRRRGRWFEY